jgi:hypothetical protein
MCARRVSGGGQFFFFSLAPDDPIYPNAIEICVADDIGQHTLYTVRLQSRAAFYSAIPGSDQTPSSLAQSHST